MRTLVDWSVVNLEKNVKELGKIRVVPPVSLPTRVSRRYVLGEFVLNIEQRLLQRASAPVPLVHKPFQVLV
jgi:hypothetical protein